ncbi:efflux RND transporter periplasmic adaptor subunit [Pseudohoeflea coraliihabitans]|uniref:Efflux RND transporter periplasmic adaptor subunit n=1 Tax=Pseudohoeflea coraliihabitans TaxID=2860393 RepID=A0ABS6WMZ7_9HYPH|nr:efflux RND transporter periplasmic adaptor subunit [Pseudohoeflea sp. DP4N28-3]MBW3097316.1 efflux RND transporter periplasmic adaptor subunit [Pseudohoeflea sp. DP4N28-3]
MLKFTLPLLFASLVLVPSEGGARAAEAAVDADSGSRAEKLAPAIVAVRAERALVADKALVNGLIAPVEEILVQPQIEGLRIDALLVDVGDEVRAGDVMARLSDDQLVLQKSQLLASKAKAEAALAQMQAQLSEAQANSGELEKTARRARQLADKGTYSRVQAEQAEAQAVAGLARVRAMAETVKVGEADIKVVQAQIDDLDLKLARTEVKAPADGLVTRRDAKIGTIASAASGAMFALIRDGALELRADVAETDLLKLAAGQKAAISVAGLREPLTGSVRLVEPTLSQQTRLGTVRIDIDAADKLKSGLFAEAIIVITEREGVVVPITSVQIGNGSASVLVLRDGWAHRVEVETGIRDGGRIEVTEGLAAGDMIVAKAGAFVRDGDRVNPVIEDDADSTAFVGE